MVKPQSESDKGSKKRSLLWYVLPVFFQIVGGLVVYYKLRTNDATTARNSLLVGIALSLVTTVVVVHVILMLHGQNDSGSRVQQAFLLQQRLTELNHPDHSLITYPNLGHTLYPSSQWTTESGPIPEYVLADLHSWLEAHSGVSHSFATNAASTIGANTSSLNTSTTSPSSKG